MSALYLQLTSWDALKETDGFESGVENVELVEPVGELHAKDLGPCGLKGCRQRQKNSILVSLSSGGLTNIGFDCGATHFPERWEELKRRNTKYRARATAVTAIQEIVDRIPQLEVQYAELSNRYSAQLALMRSFRKQVPREIIAELSRRASTGDTRVARKSTTSLMDFDGLSETETYGFLQGLNAFRIEREICSAFARAGEVLVELRRNLDLLPKDANSLARLRKDVARQADYLPTQLRTIEDGGRSAIKFFQQRNIDLVVELESARACRVKSIVCDLDRLEIAVLRRK